MKGLKEIENSLSNVIQEYKTWFDKNWMISIMLVYKEGNQATYHMAKMASNLYLKFLILTNKACSQVNKPLYIY